MTDLDVSKCEGIHIVFIRIKKEQNIFFFFLGFALFSCCLGWLLLVSELLLYFFKTPISLDYYWLIGC